MKKINIIKKNYDFDRIIKNNQPFKYKEYIIYIENRENQCYKFGISVGKKIGNAVYRNKIKRQIKNIIDQNDYKNNFNCIIIVGRGITSKNYSVLKKHLIEALNNLNIIKEKKND